MSKPRNTALLYVSVEILNEGADEPTIRVSGFTKNDKQHTFTAKIDQWSLTALAIDIRDHLIERAKREVHERLHRESPFRMPMPEPPR